MILLLLSFALAIDIPLNLNDADRDEVIKVLGIGTSTKFNSFPEPLGGFSGFEIGLSFESLPANKLNRLGSSVNNDDSFDYAKISIGKGLFHHIDVFAHFIPFDEQTGLSAYGGLLRWEAFEASGGRFSVATIFHFNSSNIEDLFISDTYGAQLQLAWQFDYVHVYCGFGSTRAKGRFKGGPTSINDTTDEVTQKLTDDLIVGGLGFNYEKYFLTAEINTSEYTFWAAKLGFRF
jgi:hypothetical protein